MNTKDFIKDYIEDVQKALETLAGNSHFLVFELVDYNTDQSKRVFYPYVSNLLSFEEEDIERIKGYKSIQHFIHEITKDKLKDELLKKYESFEIPLNLLVSALIYQTWKQGIFYQSLSSLCFENKEEYDEFLNCYPIANEVLHNFPQDNKNGRICIPLNEISEDAKEKLGDNVFNKIKNKYTGFFRAKGLDNGLFIKHCAQNNTKVTPQELVKIISSRLGLFNQVNKGHFNDGTELQYSVEGSHNSASFKLTEQSYEKLKKDGLPDDLLIQLRGLKNQIYTDENDFVEAIEKAVGSEETVKYKLAILKSAHNSLSWNEFNDIEYALIHKFDFEEKIQDLFFIVYPLIIDNYWFIGFAYLLVKEKDVSNRRYIFNKEEYDIWYKILIEMVAKPLKKALLDRAIRTINWEKNTTQDILIDALKKYFVCFDIGEQKEHDSKLLFKSEQYQYLEICIYIPNWLKKHFENNLKQEIEYLFKEIKQIEEERKIHKHKDQLELRSDLSSTFLHTFVKRGFAISGLIDKLYVSDNKTKEGKNIETIEALIYRGKTADISENMRKAYALREITNWYLSDADILYECVTYNQSFEFKKSSTPSKISCQHNLLVIILKTFADAMIIGENFNELAAGYYNILGNYELLNPYPDWIYWKKQLSECKEKLIKICTLFIDTINNYSSFNGNKINFKIQIGELSKVQLVRPMKYEFEQDDQYEKRLEVYDLFWEKIFTECFINFIRAYNTPQPATAELSIAVETRKNITVVCLSNPTQQQDFKEEKPKRPSEEMGRKGLGLFGNDMLLSQTMKIGKFTTEVLNSMFYAKIYFENPEAFELISPQ